MPLSFSEVVPVALFHDDAFRWRLATRSLAPDDWLQFDDSFDEYAAAKATILGSAEGGRGDALVTEPGSEDAAEELADLVEADLRRRARPLPSDRDTLHPIEWAARGVQEDLCLLERDAVGWRFTAAAVCFPTRWSPAEKVGLHLRAIHDPVPRYDDIADVVDRFFDRLRPGAMTWRPNWSLVGDERLRLSVHDRQAPVALPADVAAGLWLRVERQTIRRLVSHPQAAVFTIRVHRWPLSDVVAELGRLLADDLRTMPADIAAYKNIDEWRLELAAQLDAGTPQS